MSEIETGVIGGGLGSRAAEGVALQQPPRGSGVSDAVQIPEIPEQQIARLQKRVEELTASLKERKNFEEVTKHRRWFGGGVGVVALVGFGVLFVFNLGALNEMRSMTEQNPSHLWAWGVGHGLIMVAAAYFFYVLLRAAERLMLPYWWAEGAPETAKLMLGIPDPLRTAKKVSEQATKTLKEYAAIAKDLKSP